MNTNSLVVSLVLTATGSVDTDATLESAATALETLVAARETETASIASAVSAAFDTLGGKREKMGFVVAKALQTLNVQGENYKALEARVHGYLQDNASKENDGSLFSIQKGKGGGIARWSDQSAK